MDNKAFDLQRIAEGYARRPWLHKEVIEQIKKDCDIKQLKNGLDVGCGAGLSTKALRILCEHVTGTDISSEMITVCKKIYKETIDFLASGEDLSQKNSISAIGDTNSNSDKNSILQNQIRNIVVLSEAERLGLVASYEDAKKYTIENYELVKQIGGETYETIKNYMEEIHLTEDEYLEKCTDSNRKMLTRGNLYKHFIKDKNGTNEELLKQYEDYVNELIKKADIEYMD